MAHLSPYLFFDGNCREAMSFYKSCFNGELAVMTYGDMQGAACPIALKDKVMHSTLKKGDFLLMASDSPDSKPVSGTNVQLSLSCASLEELESTFKALSEKGKVSYPLHDTAWGARFGTLMDRYGIHWMMIFERKK